MCVNQPLFHVPKIINDVVQWNKLRWYR